MSEKYSQMNSKEKTTFIVGICCLVFFIVGLIIEIALMGKIFAPQIFSMLVLGTVFIFNANRLFDKRMDNEQRLAPPKYFVAPAQCPVCYSSNSLVRVSDLRSNHDPEGVGKEWRCKICGCYFNIDENGKAINY